MAMTLSKKPGKAADAGRESQVFHAQFEELFHGNWDQLCGILYRLVGDPAEAEDLALETFMQLYRRPPAKDKNLNGWLYRVATNLGLNSLRARKRRQRYEEQAGAKALEDSSAKDPAEIVERSQLRDQVRATLGAMRRRSAQVLILRHSGFSYVEIADTINVSPSSVGTLLARAEKEFERLYPRG
jgi:RNA polymerase sigma factor (sigma-70 family)